jgi:hypothetical protein
MSRKATRTVKIIFCVLIQLQILWVFGCSKSNQISNNVNVANDSKQTVSVYKDFTNKPVNLNNEKDKVKFDKQIEELNRNRDLWKSQNISNYNYTMQQFSEGMGNDWKLDFKVRDSKPIPFENMTYPELHKYEGSDTIDELFDYIKDSMEGGWNVNVGYDNKLGYPKDISVGGNDNGYMSKKIEKFEVVN